MQLLSLTLLLSTLYSLRKAGLLHLVGKGNTLLEI